MVLWGSDTSVEVELRPALLSLRRAWGTCADSVTAGVVRRRVGKLQHGEYFGEIACWTGAARSASIVTITTCELYCLQRTSLLTLAREWPDIARELKFTSGARLMVRVARWTLACAPVSGMCVRDRSWHPCSCNLILS